MSRRLMVLQFHPDPGASRVNRAMSASIAALDGVTCRDLYARYPDFNIDVAAEQPLCEQHDILVFQHPVQWYGCPALMKEWIDRVLAYGWAHGPGGDRLRDKCWLSAASAGWSEHDYGPGGRNRASLREFLLPFSQTAAHCGMQWLDPFVFYGSRRADAAGIDAHAGRYRDHLIALRDRES
jgi:glutathione-regulated potassium-efflux system ancillary protein KefG